MRGAWATGLGAALAAGGQTLDPSVGWVTYSGLALFALFGARQSLAAMCIVVVLNFLNPDLVQRPEHWAALRWLVPLAASARAIVAQLGRRTAWPSGTLPTLLFGVVALAVSAYVSSEYAASALGVLSFEAALLAVLIACNETDGDTPTAYVRGASGFVVLASLPVLFLDVGYAGSGEWFRGVLSHSQALGAYLAPVVAWRAAAVLERSGSWWDAALLAVAGAMIYVSASRTALMAITLGLAAGLVMVAGQNHRALLRRACVVATALAGCTAALIWISPGIEHRILQFVLKAGAESFLRDETGLAEATVLSRANKIHASWTNFTRRPLTGIGFGQDSEGLEVTTLVGIPVSAPREKAFLPTMLLEEVGVLGTAAFVILLASLSARAVRARSFERQVLFWSAFFVNFGEAVLFSVGGLGLHVLLLMAAGGQRPGEPDALPGTINQRSGPGRPIRRPIAPAHRAI